MWWAGICGTSLVIYFFFPLDTLLSSLETMRSSSSASHPPSHAQTLTRFHLLQVFNTLPQSPSLFTRAKNRLQSVASENHDLHNPPPPPLHSTALPLLWAWAFTQKLILPREAFLNLEKRGCSLEFEPKWTWSRPFDRPFITWVDKLRPNVRKPQTSVQETAWGPTQALKVSRETVVCPISDMPNFSFRQAYITGGATNRRKVPFSAQRPC